MTSPRTSGFAFDVVATDGHARTAVFKTPHADVETPTFMPVGTQGCVKGLTPDEVAATGAQIVLGNTYHLWLRPGPEVIAGLGGLHGFSRWPRAMLTDSGGFQAFSLGAGSGGKDPLVKLDETGFTFRSHLDGSRHALTPEEAVRVQGLIGADIQMQLDVCPPGESPRALVEEAVARTTRWARRALAAPRPERQALFGIVQGACFPDLRRRHAEELASLDVEGRSFDGLALGGFSVGEPIPRMYETLHEMAHVVDAQRPRYLMGVGTPRDLLEAIDAGIDMFDCVLPTRNARNGQALTRFGRVVVKQAQWREDKRPIDPECACPCCSGGYSRAYLRHLYLAGEMTVLRLLSAHNLHWYGELVAGARAAIRGGTWSAYKAATIARLDAGE
jgi:queuine tRNA-ribosyltransferase